MNLLVETILSQPFTQYMYPPPSTWSSLCSPSMFVPLSTLAPLCRQVVGDFNKELSILLFILLKWSMIESVSHPVWLQFLDLFWKDQTLRSTTLQVLWLWLSHINLFAFTNVSDLHTHPLHSYLFLCSLVFLSVSWWSSFLAFWLFSSHQDLTYWQSKMWDGAFKLLPCVLLTCWFNKCKWQWYLNVHPSSMLSHSRYAVLWIAMTVLENLNVPM